VTLAQRLLPADPASRAASLSVYMNVALMALKVGVGIAAGSVAVLSDGIDSGQDLVAATIALVSVRIGSRPANHEHPYGLGRVETLAASLQGMLIGGGGVFIVASAIYRLVEPPDHVGYDVGIVAMLIAAAVNVALVQYTGRVARQTNSPAIASEARHLWTNVVQAGAVVLGLVLVGLTDAVDFDAIVALALGVYLLMTAGRILWSAVGDVLDKPLSPEEIAEIHDAILAEPGVEGYHWLRTRRSGQVRHIDFHVTLPGAMTVDESHALNDRIEARIEALWPGSVVIVHVEPVGTEPPPGTGL
jgi:cation diffusion facilitator family transporter